jgi:hypothetical protein
VSKATFLINFSGSFSASSPLISVSLTSALETISL